MPNADTLENRSVQPNDDTYRRSLFWNYCIPLRLGIVVLLLVVNTTVPVTLYFTFLYTAITAITMLVFAIRRYPYGGFKGVVWWSRIRYFHILTYVATSALAFKQQKWAGLILLLDVAVGATAGYLHYTT